MLVNQKKIIELPKSKLNNI